MDETGTYAGVLLVLLVGTGMLVALGSGAGATGTGAGGDVPVTPASERGYERTVDGVKYTVHPSELVRGCLRGSDCIPSIDDPEFHPAPNATRLDRDALVIGLERDGEAKAYPLGILAGHEIVNDELAGDPIAVTYCPLCRSGIVFSRSVDGRTLTFGVSGKLLNANLVMYDRQTGTYWSQLRARAIVGPLVPSDLDQLPSTITTWGEWRRAHPDTLVLYDNNSHALGIDGRDRYRTYRESEGVGYGVGETDERLPNKEIVYGVTVGGASKAYPEDAVTAKGVIHDEIGGLPVLVVESPRDGGVTVFAREIDNRTLTFTMADDGLVDGAGNRWSLDGEALEGPYRGTRLTRLDAHGFYWFAWSSFNPETGIYRG